LEGATNTNFWPSGEIAIDTTSDEVGTSTSKRFSALPVCCAIDVSAINR
jgi:hypothetical protein